MALTRWQPPSAQETQDGAAPELTLRTAMFRGLRGQCPACGKAHLFDGWLKVVPECKSCGAPLGLARADDLPPYITIFIAGHIIVPLMLWLEKAQAPSTLMMAAIFLPLTLVLTLALMRPVKGAILGLMLKLGLAKAEPEQA